MKYVIDEDTCKKKGLTLPALLAILLIKTGVNIPDLFNSLEEEKIIVRDIFDGFLITQRWDDVCSDILLTSDKVVPEEDRLDALVDKIRSIYPEGKKDGTSVYWRGNRKDIRLRLKKFFKLYGEKYTDEQIIEATQRYVDSFNGQYGYMRILMYFIWKNVRRVDAEGVGFIEEVSDLATYIENAGQPDTLKDDWTSTVN